MSGIELGRAEYYKPSGDFTVAGPLLMLGIGAVAAVILGSVYGYLIQYNPIVYINVIGALVFGGGLGWAAGIGIRRGKVRAPLIATLDGLAVGAMGVFVAWVVWIHAFAGRAGANVWIFNPAELWAVIQQVAATGAWSLKGATPTGLALYAVWAIEALMIAGICVLVCRNAASKPFCEPCAQWAQSKTPSQSFGAVDDLDALRRRLEAGEIDALAALGAPSPERSLAVTLLECPTCNDAGFLTVETITLIEQKKGQKTSRRQDVLRNLIVRGRTLELVRSLMQRQHQESGTIAPVAAK
ncbi:MAG: hypothetical protein L0Y44_04255 [Phycisphaerales bacterium]|nr:hypothetical protein [Phycisphaerales bacterium]MCI0629851.1 hypothetical protein [Phycisphaerales bacterium]